MATAAPLGMVPTAWPSLVVSKLPRGRESSRSAVETLTRSQGGPRYSQAMSQGVSATQTPRTPTYSMRKKGAVGEKEGLEEGVLDGSVDGAAEGGSVQPQAARQDSCATVPSTPTTRHRAAA